MASTKLPAYKRLGDVLAEGEVITVKELARLLGVSDSYIRRLARQEKIPAKKKGRDWIITGEAIFTTKRLAEYIGLSHSYTRHLLSGESIPGSIMIGRDRVFVNLEKVPPKEIYARKRRKKRKHKSPQKVIQEN